MSELDKYRVEINEIDDKIIELFEARMHVAKKVGLYKKKRNLPILNKDREAIVIERNVSKLKDKSLANYATRFFEKLMDLSKELQEKL